MMYFLLLHRFNIFKLNSAKIRFIELFYNIIKNVYFLAKTLIKIKCCGPEKDRL